MRQIGLEHQAASLGVGLCVGLLLEYVFWGGTPIELRDGALLARGTLERALNQQLSGPTPTTEVAHIGASFRSRGGAYCRTFELADSRTLSGLACKEQARWRIDALVGSDAGRSAGAAARRGGGIVLPAVLQQAVNERLSGEPRDAAAEALARSKGWH